VGAFQQGVGFEQFDPARIKYSLLLSGRTAIDLLM
jgi:hypothetical protein